MIGRSLRRAQPPGIAGPDARPARVGEAQVLAVRVLGHVLDADAGRVLADGEDDRGMPAVDVARHAGRGERVAPALLVGGIEVGGIDLGLRSAIDPKRRGRTSRARRAARGPRRSEARGSTVARMVRPPVNSSSSPKLLGELAADLVGEVVARRHLAAGGVDVAALHGQRDPRPWPSRPRRAVT